LAIAMGCLFLITYALALADPVPHRIDAALVGEPADHPSTVDAVERVAKHSLAFPLPFVPGPRLAHLE
jgi:hypothetical protein